LIALLATGVILSVTGFTIGWAVCRRIHNYSFLDVIWSLSVGALAALYAVLGSGTLERRAAFGCVGLAWSSRLGIYILIRVMRAHPVERMRATARCVSDGPAPWAFCCSLRYRR
jgi:steroid 5-alpha reductase family enzyme